LIDGVLLLLVGIPSGLVFRGIAVFLSLVQFLATSAARRDVVLLLIVCAVARSGSIAFASTPSPYGAFSLTVGLQIFILAVVALTLHMVVTASERQAAVEAALARSE